MTEKLLTATDLAERWQVSTAQVYRLAREGTLPVVKIGRYRRFRLDEIERWEAVGGSPLSPADVARKYWHPSTMPKTMKRLGRESVVLPDLDELLEDD